MRPEWNGTDVAVGAAGVGIGVGLCGERFGKRLSVRALSRILRLARPWGEPGERGTEKVGREREAMRKRRAVKEVRILLTVIRECERRCSY